MAVSHIKIDPQGDFTGTVTIFDSGGATATVNATDMVRPSDWNSVHNQYMTLSGNTVGASTASGSNIVFQGGNNITLSGNGDTIVFIGGAGVGGGIGLAAGTRTATTSGTVLFSNANGVTFGLDTPGGSVMTASVSQSVQTQASGNIARTGITTGATAGSLLAATHDTAGISFGVPAWITTTPAQTNQSAIKGFGVSNTGQTAGNTGISTGIDWVLAGSQSITLSQSTAVGGPNTVWLQHPAWITTARASTDGIGLATALTAGPLAWTVNSAGLSLNAGSAAGTTSGFAGTNISGSITHNTAGINIALSVAAPGGGGTVTMYATSNTTQSSTGTANLNSLIFAGAGAASVGISNGSVVISAPNAAAGNVTFSAGTTNGGLANVLFGDSNNMSFGLNGSTITASFNAINFGVSTMGNTAGTTGTVEGAGGQYLLVGSNNITLSQSVAGANSGTLTIVGPSSSSIVGATGIGISTNGNTISIYEVPRSSWVSPDMALSNLGALGNGSFSIAYRDVYDPVTATRVDCPFAWQQATTANANTVAIAMTVLFGIYTRNASTLNTVTSGSTRTTYTYASNSAGNTQLTVNAYRPISLPVNVNMAPGAYYFGFGLSTSASSIGTATTTAAQTISVVGVPQISSAVPWTDEFTRVTATSVGMFSGHGIYSAAVNSVVPAISLSAINQSGSYFHRANIALVFRN